MRQVFKYQLITTDEQEVEIPAGAQILSAQIQHDLICVWALVDPSSPLMNRLFYIHGTGHEVASKHALDFVGTVQMLQGALVCHVFVVPER